MSLGELRECFSMLNKDKSGGVTIDVVLEFFQKLTSRRKVTRQQLMDWSNQPEGEMINLANFSQLAEMTRVACEQGTVSSQIEKMRRVFVGEIFTIIDTNKDGKVSKSEVETFLCGCDIPEQLTPSDVRELLRIGDIGNNLSKEDFNMLIIDIFLEEGDRAGFLPILVKCARKEQEARTQQKLKAVASFSKIVGKMRSFSIKNSSFAPSHPSPPDSPTSPSSSQPNEQQEISSPIAGGSLAPSSPSSLGPDLVKRKSGKWSSWKAAAGGKKSAVVAAQQQQQLEEIKNLKLEVSRLTSENEQLAEENREQKDTISKLDDELQLYSSTASLNTDSLKHQLFQYQSEITQLRPLKSDVETLNGQLLAKQSQIETLTAELSQQKELYNREIEKARELSAIRKQEQQESLRYKTDLSKIKVQLRQLDEDLTEKQKTIERMEFDKRVEAIEAAGLNATTGGLASTNKFADTVDFLDPPESSDLDGVLFLNPPNHVETVDTINSTLFESVGPIYYTLASPIRPSQLMFDIKVSSSSVSEYITCRDDSSNRSLSLTIDQSFVSIPATALSFKLSDDWNTISVTFSWQRQSYALFLGSMKVCSDQSFRDRGVSNVAAFDIYPRTDSAISYANIRFLY